MHHCLTVPEIVDEITSYCNYSSLARLARTAHLFDCTLDRLWAKSPIQHLLECFTFEVVQCSQDPDYYHRRWTLLKHPESRHWERFHFYAKRVKEIELYTENLDSALIDVLCLSAPQGGLLPRQYCCNLSISRLSQFRLVQPFVSPTLQELRMIFDERPQSLPEDFISFWKSLPSLCPELTSLDLRWSPDGTFLGLPTLLWSFQNLTRLHIQHIEATHFPLIASMSQLSHLTVVCLDDNAIPPQESPTAMCRSLRYLSISSSINCFQTLFHFISRCPLEEMYVFLQDDSWCELDKILRVICDKCERPSLRRLEIDGPRDDGEGRPLQGDSFFPLLDFPNIVRFVCPFYMVAVVDHHISILAKSWRKLVYLDLICGAFSGEDPIPLTLKSLESLVLHCPYLTYLGIEFVTEKFEFDVESPPAGGASNELVYEIDVGGTQLDISQVPHVAAYLSSLFPNLWACGSLEESEWEYVAETARLMTARVRQQEQLLRIRSASSGTKGDSLA